MVGEHENEEGERCWGSLVWRGFLKRVGADFLGGRSAFCRERSLVSRVDSGLVVIR